MSLQSLHVTKAQEAVVAVWNTRATRAPRRQSYRQQPWSQPGHVVDLKDGCRVAIVTTVKLDDARLKWFGHFVQQDWLPEWQLRKQILRDQPPQQVVLHLVLQVLYTIVVDVPQFCLPPAVISVHGVVHVATLPALDQRLIRTFLFYMAASEKLLNVVLSLTLAQCLWLEQQLQCVIFGLSRYEVPWKAEVVHPEDTHENHFKAPTPD